MKLAVAPPQGGYTAAAIGRSSKGSGKVWVRPPNFTTKEYSMAEDRMRLSELLEKAGAGDSVRETIGFVAQRLIFPNESPIYRLVGVLLLEQNDEWALQRRYLTLETLANLGENPHISLPAVAS